MIKVTKLSISKYSTKDRQTVCIETECGKQIEVDLYANTPTAFLPNQVRVKTNAQEWGFKAPVCVNFGHPFED